MIETIKIEELIHDPWTSTIIGGIIVTVIGGIIVAFILGRKSQLRPVISAIINLIKSRITIPCWLVILLLILTFSIILLYPHTTTPKWLVILLLILTFSIILAYSYKQSKELSNCTQGEIINRGYKILARWRMVPSSKNMYKISDWTLHCSKCKHHLIVNNADNYYCETCKETYGYKMEDSEKLRKIKDLIQDKFPQDYDKVK
ncbi:hypothetical protein BEH94_10560 [Candidatus Altiarchaeales archaeon WOR_SM1_SCG]|nr:hypothetical protein BEH94_10560 [Candidatus Altiarchaeales archaeon WOR_SM1_SCG]